MNHLLKLTLAACLGLFLLPAQAQELTLNGPHGKLAVTYEKPVGFKKFPLAILCHGFTSNRNDPLMQELSAALLKRGVATVRFDFNGHGESEGKFEDMTVPKEVLDARAIYDFASGQSEVLDIMLIGHSQGGVVAALTAAQLEVDRVKALVLLAPAAVMREDALRGNLFGVQFDPTDPPQTVEIFDNHKVGRDYILTAQKLPIYERAATYEGFAFVVHGLHDTTVPYTYGERFAEDIRLSAVRLIDNADHVFTGMQRQVADLVAEFASRASKLDVSRHETMNFETKN